MTLTDQIAGWYTLPDPVVTLYLDLSLADSGAGHDDLHGRWRSLRERLVAEGAAEPALVLLDKHVAELQAANATSAAMSDGERLFHARIDEIADLASAGPLPHAAPLLRWCQRRVPWAVALVDRKGGELTAYDTDGTQLRRSEVTGPDDEIERNAPGGWAQARYQRRAEDSWLHNAGAVGRELTGLVDTTAVRVVAVAGDVRALQLLAEHVPPRVAPLLRHIERGGGRGVDGSAAIRTAAIDEMVRAVATAENAAELGRFRDGLGTAKLSVVGLAATVGALRRKAVDTLIVADGRTDGRVGWWGDDPTSVSLNRGAETDRHAPVVDVLLRAAFGTDARVLVLDEPLPEAPDGVAAVCRFRL